MDMQAQEEACIAEKQAAQEAHASEEAAKVIAEEGGVHVAEYEAEAAQNHGI